MIDPTPSPIVSIKNILPLMQHAIQLAFVLAALLLASPVLAQAPEPLTPDERATAAVIHRLEGQRHVAQYRITEALDSYRAAWRIFPTKESACAIGRLELNAGHAREAAEYLLKCKRLPSTTPDAPPPGIEQIEAESFAKALAEIARITLDSPPGYLIAIDGVPIGTTPLPDPIVLDPGTYQLGASTARIRIQREIRVCKGDERTFIVTGDDAGDAPTITCPSQPSCVTTLPDKPLAPQVTTHASPEVVIVGAAATVLSMALGTAFWLEASGSDVTRDRDFSMLTLRTYTGSCRNGQNDALCSSMFEAESHSRNMTRAGIAMFLTGSAIAAGTVAYGFATTVQAGPSGASIGVSIQW